jgi:hypothetical protein
MISAPVQQKKIVSYGVENISMVIRIAVAIKQM